MLIFDMDGTLIDSNGIWKEIDVEFLRKHGMEYCKEYYEGVAHTVFPKAAEFTKEYCHLDETIDEIMSEWMEMAGDVYSKKIPIKPGVRDYLELMKPKNEQMVILTSSVPEHAYAALNRLDLIKYFDEIFFSQRLGLDKNNPLIFQTVADKMYVDPRDCTLYDDSVVSCASAKSLGMKIVAVYDEFFDSTESEMKNIGDLFIKSFKELL